MSDQGVKILSRHDLLRNHEFVRIYTNDEGLMRVELNLPDEASGQFGTRDDMERLQGSLAEAADFLTSVFKAVSSALSESYLAEVKKSLEKGTTDAPTEQGSQAPAPEKGSDPSGSSH
jgi:hypothetical protein